MKTYSISELAKRFGLSRSTLLYYDRIGLLRAPERTVSDYRRYTRRELDRLERICTLRATGLALDDVRTILSDSPGSCAGILEGRLRDIETQIAALRGQQHQIVAMLKELNSGAYGPAVDKALWVRMLEKAGLDAQAQRTWHAEFERRAPEAHNDFLLSLGIPEGETQQIRQWARQSP